MAFSAITTRGSATEKVSDTSISLNPSANLTVGKVVIVQCATDNDSTAVSDGASTRHSLSDSKGNTWTKISERTDSDGAAADGVTISLWRTVITTQINTTDTITLTCSSAVTNKIISCFEATVGTKSTIAVEQVGVGQSAISASVSSLPSREYLLVGFGGSEGNDNAKTPGTNYTERFDLRTGSGTASTEICTHVVTRIATLTSDTCTSSAWTNTNPVFLLAAIYEVPNTAPTISPNTADAYDFGADTTPTLEATATDGQSDDVRYEFQVDTVNTFDSQNGTEAVDQQQNSTGANFGFGEFAVVRYRGQVFTCGASGKLTKIGFARNKGSQGVKVYIDTVDGSNLPAHAVGSELYSFTIANADVIDEYGEYAVPVPPTLVAGTKYCIYLAPWDTSGNAYADDYQDVRGIASVSGGVAEITNNNGTWSTESLTFQYKTYITPTTPLLDKVSGTDTGFANTVTGGDTDPFNSGEKVSYTVQAGDALTDGTYYWRARAIDPNGINTWSSWTTARSFTIQTGTPVTVNAGVIAATLTVLAPVVTAIRNATIAGAVVGSMFTVQAPNITTVRNLSVTPSAVASTFSIPTPGISIGDSVTPAPISSTFILPAPTVLAVRNVATTPGPLSMSGSVPQPIVLAVKNATASPSPITASLSIPAPSVTTTMSVAVDADIVEGSYSVPSPTVSVGDNVSPAPLSATFVVPDPIIATQRSVQVSVSPVSMTASIPTPTATGEIGVTVAPGVITRTLAVQAPTIHAVRNITVTPAIPCSGILSIPTPTITATDGVRKPLGKYDRDFKSVGAPLVQAGLDMYNILPRN